MTTSAAAVQCTLCCEAHETFSVTCSAPVNIAVIKYWGKRNEDLILPLNSSLSVTLTQDQMRSRTTVAASPEFSEDFLCINGREEDVNNKRIQAVLKQVREKVAQRDKKTGRDWFKWKIHISSENNFPTAAGLASSASGYACIVYSLGKLFHLDCDLSLIARLGSGSACRSMYGGFVEWTKGKKEDGLDSAAVQIAPHMHWPELETLIIVVSKEKKILGSTAGMQATAQTSELLKHRVSHLVPERLEKMKAAILAKDFNIFAELTMKDSNEMHACCLDTTPPISYLTDTSHHIQRLVHWLNDLPELSMKKKDKYIVAYTFDAGPNAVLFTLKKNIQIVKAALQYFYQTNDILSEDHFKKTLDMLPMESCPMPVYPGCVEKVIHAQLGEGPKVEHYGSLVHLPANDDNAKT